MVSPRTSVFPSSHNAFVPSSIMMSPAMTTQLPLPLSSLQFLPFLSLSIVEKPSGQLPGQSVVGSDRRARGQRREGGRPPPASVRWYNQMADYWTKRLEFQRHNDTHLSLPLLPLDPRPFSHLWPPLSPIDVCCGRNVQRLRRFINRSARKSKREGSWILGQISSYSVMLRLAHG